MNSISGRKKGKRKNASSPFDKAFLHLFSQLWSAFQELKVNFNELSESKAKLEAEVDQLTEEASNLRRHLQKLKKFDERNIPVQVSPESVDR